jgi:hypothetical protein
MEAAQGYTFFEVRTMHSELKGEKEVDILITENGSECSKTYSRELTEISGTEIG